MNQNNSTLFCLGLMDQAMLVAEFKLVNILMENKDEEIEIRMGKITCPKCDGAYLGLVMGKPSMICWNCMHRFDHIETGNVPDEK